MIIPYMGIIVQGKGLWRALFTRTQRRLLGLLYGHPDRSFYANELVRLAGVGTGSVQRELARLTRAGVFSMQRVGNQKHYRANRDCPLYPELRSIVIKTFGVLDLIRGALRGFKQQVHLAFLFGEVAGAVQLPLQLLVVANDLKRAEIETALEPAGQRLGRKIEITLLGRARFEKLLVRPNERFTQVMAQPRVVLVGQLPDPVGRPHR